MANVNKGRTVKELFEACKLQIAKGNGDKYILISNDDEGNGFHTLFYLITDNAETIGYALESEHDSHTADEVVVLG